MLNLVARPLINRVAAPLGRALASTGISPDVITWTGTIGLTAAALVFYPRGEFLWGTLVILVFVFSDLLDGTVARARGGGSLWGAFLDSSLDRVGDAAVFGGILLWWVGEGDDFGLAALTLYCLVTGVLTSYVKARAQGLGMHCDVGIVERGERLIIVLAATGFAGLLGQEVILVVALWVLAVGSTVTVAQRLRTVHQQAAGRPAPGSPADAAAAGPGTGPARAGGAPADSRGDESAPGADPRASSP